jgi:hypothetical protein
MAYVSQNYLTNADAPMDVWVCTRTSKLGPYKTIPPEKQRKGSDFCGQCVSFVTTVCPSIPVGAGNWKKGSPVKGNLKLAKGTAIATFPNGTYSGHAAIYESQDGKGMTVYDQWVTGAGKAIGSRVIKWDGNGIANKGDGYYVIE